MEGTQKIQGSGKGRGRRRLGKVPPAPVPVKYLWEAASEEEKKKAHQTGAAILELWMGRASRQEVGDLLGIPPLRVWQLSRQALSGLVAGLLKQPKARKKALKALALGEENPVRLKARMASMEKQLARMQTLVELLRQMPAHREEPKGKSVALKRKKKKKASVPKTRPTDRKETAAKREDELGGPVRDRGGAQGERSDGAKLDPNSL